MFKRFILFLGVTILIGVCAAFSEYSNSAEPNKIKTNDIEKTEKATFAGGCFWCMQPPFDNLGGVISTKVGYIGGPEVNPTYKDVAYGRTGHAEAIEIKYDPSVIGYEGLLEKLWEFHDPTTLNRQGPDQGTQYRSAIFYLDELQKNIAEKSIAALDASGKFQNPVVTSLEVADKFWRAEEYHQKYLEKKGITIACVS